MYFWELKLFRELSSTTTGKEEIICDIWIIVTKVTPPI